jgi:signal transduction histidine kinase
VSSVAYHREEKKFSHQSLANEIQRDFQFRDSSLDSRFKSGMFEEAYKNNKTPYLPINFFFFIVRDSSTLVWNTTVVDVPCDIKNNPDLFLKGEVRKLSDGYFYVKTWRLQSDTAKASAHAVSIIPILYNYPIENQYFQSHFVADSLIPNNTEVLIAPAKGAFPILNREGKTIFYVHFLQASETYFTAGFLTWFLAILACLCIVIWIHECCYGVGLKTGKQSLGFLLLLLFIIPASLLAKHLVFPAGFQNSKIFSPELYSTTEGIKSFGDLIVTVMLASWALVYVISYIELSKPVFVKNLLVEKTIRAILIVGMLVYIYAYFTSDITKLIIDSKISFEAGNFSNLNVYTFVGIFIVVALTINLLIILGVINAFLRFLIKKWYWRMCAFLALSIAVNVVLVLISKHVTHFLPKNTFRIFDFTLILLALISMLLIDRFGFPLKKRKNHYDLRLATSSYVWFAILSSMVTIEIYYFNYSKEIELRKVFAHKREQQDEGSAAFMFTGMMDDIQKDSTVNTFFHGQQNADIKKNLGQYINYVYLHDYSNIFNIGVYFYDKDRKPLLQQDSVDNAILRYADSIHKSTFEYGLMDIGNLGNGDYIYWFISPFLDSTGTDTLGYLGFNVFADKRYRKGKAISFFEIRKNATDEQYYNNYAYAVYHNSNLLTQSGEIAFPYYHNDTLKKGVFSFAGNFTDSSALLYRSSKNETIKVVYSRNLLTNIISLFSYVLATILVLSGLIFVLRNLVFYPGRLRLVYKNLTLTIRSKVNLTILITVFLSLFVVGFITLSFLSTRYKEAQKKNMQSQLMFYSQFIAHTAEEGSLDIVSMKSTKQSIFSDFSYKMNRLAEEQGAEVNIYNLTGRLVATSQIDFYQKGLLSRYMDRKALLSLGNQTQNEFVKDERLGQLKYKSLYAPIRNKYDRVIGYLNIPYYASGLELNNEISSVLVTLVNVYALIFFLSGICAIIISNSIIRSFKLLIDQFRNIRLHHNEYIQWPHRDEIALLVNEYNSMMKKVEMMATRLARTEREAAWRDIARQVAHEIKNPLTPMKLNIQYLQQAIASNRPDIEKLALKVAGVLIEQIENLNIIASEFSNFAKMPEAAPEDLNIHEALLTLVHLFQKNNEVAIDLLPSNESLLVYMDKGYLIRVFTNLIQNAIQSIETNKRGKVIISYEQIEHNVVINIEDNGGGIPVELREKLFQPYFTTKSSGTGLGLPMTKSLIESSGGFIVFETEEGKGTKFIVTLPIGERE